MSQPFASIHIAKSLKNADAQTKTCQRVWLPNRTDRQRRIKHENTTRYIKHLAESANFKGSTFNKLCNGLIGNRFEMPNVSYTQPLYSIRTDRSMRIITTIILLGVFLTTNAQKTITYEKLRDELINSSEPEIISIYSNHLEQKSELYLIDLIKDGILSEPPLYDTETKKQLTAEIVTTSELRKRIVDSLNSNGFLDTLYLRTDTVYTNIHTPNDYFVIDKPLIVIEILHGYDSEIIQTYLIVNKKEQADILLEIISNVLDKKQRGLIKQYRENIKRLEN